MIGILFEVFLDIFSILFFEKIVNEKERSDEKCGIISKEFYKGVKYSLQGTTQGRYLTGGVLPVRFSM